MKTTIQNRRTLVQLDQREADCLREFLYICSDTDDRGLDSILTTPEAIARTAALWESEYGQHPLDADELALVSALAGMDTDVLHITSNERPAASAVLRRNRRRSHRQGQKNK